MIRWTEREERDHGARLTQGSIALPMAHAEGSHGVGEVQ